MPSCSPHPSHCSRYEFSMYSGTAYFHPLIKQVVVGTKLVCKPLNTNERKIKRKEKFQDQCSRMPLYFISCGCVGRNKIATHRFQGRQTALMTLRSLQYVIQSVPEYAVPCSKVPDHGMRMFSLIKTTQTLESSVLGNDPGPKHETFFF